MDSVHDPDDRISISEPVHVGQFKKIWSELTKDKVLYKEKITPENENEELARRLNLPLSAVDDVALDCSIANLDQTTCPVSTSADASTSLEGETSNLVTVRVLHQIDKQCQENKNFQKLMKFHSKYRFFEPALRTSYSKKQEQAVEALLKDEALLLTNVYQPYRKNSETKNFCLKIEQEIVVLSSQFLTDLRDHITCLGDVSVMGDYSLTPDVVHDTRAKDIWTSGFFYINGTFYNDMRNPMSRDYSSVITEWASKNPELGIGPFESKKMEETTFQDLELRLGYPYVYQHLGNCEHLIIFRDLRMLSLEDHQAQAKYPLIQGISKRRRITCMVCHRMTATWVTTGNSRLDHDPFFFCDTCFHSFNYDASKKKIGEFQAHPFVDRSSLL